jgi:hypothetical protein
MERLEGYRVCIAWLRLLDLALDFHMQVLCAELFAQHTEPSAGRYTPGAGNSVSAARHPDYMARYHLLQQNAGKSWPTAVTRPNFVCGTEGSIVWFFIWTYFVCYFLFYLLLLQLVLYVAMSFLH